MQISPLAIPLVIPDLPEGKNAQPAPFGICLDPPLSPSSELPPTSAAAAESAARQGEIYSVAAVPSSSAARRGRSGTAGPELRAARRVLGLPIRPCSGSSRPRRQSSPAAEELTPAGGPQQVPATSSPYPCPLPAQVPRSLGASAADGGVEHDGLGRSLLRCRRRPAAS